MFASLRRLLGLDSQPIYGGRKRSPKWRALSDRFLKEHPACAATGRIKGKGIIVVAHHIIPYHVQPDLELEWENLIPMSEGGTWNAHLWMAHLGEWADWNPRIREDAAEMKELLLTRSGRRAA